MEEHLSAVAASQPVGTWRGRTLLVCYGDLPGSFTVNGTKCTAKLRATDRTGMRMWIVDAALEEVPLIQAFYSAIDIGDELCDRLSFLTFAPVESQLVSVTVQKAKIGETFLLALQLEAFRRSTVSVTSDAIERFDSLKDDIARTALRTFRKALSSGSPYRTLSELWTTIETLAQSEAKDASDFVVEPCSGCGKQRTAGLRSQKYIRAHFLNTSDSSANESAADATRTVRSRLVHGARLHDSALREEVEGRIPLLQAACATALARRLELAPLCSHCQSVGIPFQSFNVTVTGGAEGKTKLAFNECVVPSALSVLPESLQIPKNFSIMIGLFEPIHFDTIALPDMEAPKVPHQDA
jgi:hypothetical protein